MGGCGSEDATGGGQSAPIGYAYVTSAGSTPDSRGAVYEYGIMVDGSVSPLAKASIGAGINPATVVVQDGCVYVVNVGDGTISQYYIEPDNTLAPMNPATVTNPGMQILSTAGTSAAAVDPTGQFLYVANTADDTVSQFSIGSDGQLTPLTPAALATGIQPISIVTSGSGVYVVNSGASGDLGSVSQFSEASNGALVPADAAPLAAGTNPTVIAFDSIYSTAYVVSNCDGAECLGSIRQFTVGTGGALTDTGSIVTTGSHYRATSMAIDQDGPNAYLLSNEMGVDTLNGTLWHFQVGGTGALTADTPSPLPLQGVAVTQSIQRSTLYVLTTNSGVNASSPATGGSIIAYVEGSAGTLTLEATTALVAPYPASMAIRLQLEP